ncbi:hypothetical protein [Streptomyces sp. NPDC050145]|uniref:hypothetical protein n=1 Tax=Streptomyces sp. NPDC050145 TaxID=3365602 RepID=UPI0037ACA9AB
MKAEEHLGSGGTPEEDFECQIYVAAPSRDRLMERLAAALHVSLDADHMMTFGCVDVEWTHNDYEGTGARDDSPFLNWHSLLMCQPHHGAASTAFVSDTATILEALRGAGYRAVPVCDYEELLPESGIDHLRSDSAATRRSSRVAAPT